LAPGTGPLSSALIGLRDGTLAWVDGDDVSAWRRRDDVAFAFQSYPTLLAADGRVPDALRDTGSINLTHRDARLAIGLDRDDRLLVVLTRLTVPEMAAVMGALGARQAMLLDGGISAQLALRDSLGVARQWPGIRKVPLALVAR
jgi:exopolysaccharide biosynthesis protein